MKCLLVWFHNYKLIEYEVQTFLDSSDEVFVYKCKDCGKVKLKRRNIWTR